MVDKSVSDFFNFPPFSLNSNTVSLKNHSSIWRCQILSKLRNVSANFVDLISIILCGKKKVTLILDKHFENCAPLTLLVKEWLTDIRYSRSSTSDAERCCVGQSEMKYSRDPESDRQIPWLSGLIFARKSEPQYGCPVCCHLIRDVIVWKRRKNFWR